VCDPAFFSGNLVWVCTPELRGLTKRGKWKWVEDHESIINVGALGKWKWPEDDASVISEDDGSVISVRICNCL